MSRLTPKSSRCSRRAYLCCARGGTLFGIAILAVASCQSFREGPTTGAASPVADYLEYDACLDRGGRWLMHAHACIEQGEAGVREPREAL
ncbi:hypothetical protein BJI69_04330 [Luteibacter rhizovicinus DSM 16549]|uniref:Uncharacterized protein n=1 Tax=Luteibacter rhizovicinus DSM 16549 TaxID=1440763 RepID=A0A0G9HBQ0_9GAMM|nr:hypothetical protein [Luteibacter rhizovicinus]APG03209.1 hypothetical protein BJI69_04330 [Luteibacter rhizovicinus DSM 16549]KLD66901.1 hypothetical protein Y883_11280 [Luteibacter rhizovicinus DSM 16549]